MNKFEKDVLMSLSKEQLIYLIEQYEHSQFLISLTCVRESKWELDSDKAVDKIREYIYDAPSFDDENELKAYIDMKMNKISVKEYRKIIGLDD